VGTTCFVVSWIDHDLRDRAAGPRTRVYGTASSKQPAIRLAERVLPPGAEYIVTTLHRTVYRAHASGVPPPARRRR
jgi:hypothetical protein